MKNDDKSTMHLYILSIDSTYKSTVEQGENSASNALGLGFSLYFLSVLPMETVCTIELNCTFYQ